MNQSKQPLDMSEYSRLKLTHQKIESNAIVIYVLINGSFLTSAETIVKIRNGGFLEQWCGCFEIRALGLWIVNDGGWSAERRHCPICWERGRTKFQAFLDHHLIHIFLSQVGFILLKVVNSTFFYVSPSTYRASALL